MVISSSHFIWLGYKDLKLMIDMIVYAYLNRLYIVLRNLNELGFLSSLIFYCYLLLFSAYITHHYVYFMLMKCWLLVVWPLVVLNLFKHTFSICAHGYLTIEFFWSLGNLLFYWVISHPKKLSYSWLTCIC